MRPDPNQARGDARASEARVLREETVAGMDRIGAAARGHVEDFLNVEIAGTRRGRPQAIGFVRVGDVKCVPVGVGIERNGLQA